MEIDEAAAKIEQYGLIFDKYVPKEKVERGQNSNSDCYSVIRWACIETLVILDGDEEIFKKCLEETKKRCRSMGWVDFDKYNTKPAANYIRNIAHLMKK